MIFMILHSAGYRNAYSRLLFKTELFRSLEHPSNGSNLYDISKYKMNYSFAPYFQNIGLVGLCASQRAGGGGNKRNQGDHSEEKEA